GRRQRGGARLAREGVRAARRHAGVDQGAPAPGWPARRAALPRAAAQDAPRQLAVTPGRRRGTIPAVAAYVEDAMRLRVTGLVLALMLGPVAARAAGQV